jgi:hypothetical protein
MQTLWMTDGTSIAFMRLVTDSYPEAMQFAHEWLDGHIHDFTHAFVTSADWSTIPDCFGVAYMVSNIQDMATIVDVDGEMLKVTPSTMVARHYEFTASMYGERSPYVRESDIAPFTCETVDEIDAASTWECMCGTTWHIGQAWSHSSNADCDRAQNGRY